MSAIYNFNTKSKSFFTDTMLFAGDNLITHNLGLLPPYYVTVDTRDSTGGQVFLKIKNLNTNTCTLSVISKIQVSIKIS